jgi:hypothetical protein
MENKDGGPEPRPTTPVVSWASIREISGLIKTQWPRYLVDILVIILGITISFTLDSRKEEADRATLEQVYLKSLLTDDVPGEFIQVGVKFDRAFVFQTTSYAAGIAETAKAYKS